MSDKRSEKPVLLKAIELVLADPKDIQRECQSLLAKFQEAHEGKPKEQVRNLAANKIIRTTATTPRSQEGQRLLQASFLASAQPLRSAEARQTQRFQ